MAWTLRPTTERVRRIREMYRSAQPEICLARYKIITDFYTSHPELGSILRRAKALLEICEKLPVRIGDGEVIVGTQATKFRAAALYPENSVGFLKEEIGSGFIRTRDIDPYVISDEDAKYVMDTIGYWEGENENSKAVAYLIDEYAPHENNGITMLGSRTICDTPVGHFVTGYDKAIRTGFAAIKAEADRKKADLVAAGLPGNTVEQYNFYRAVSIVCQAIITLTKRYAALAKEKAGIEKDPKRKAELLMMAEGLSWTVEKPARTFYEAVQCLFMYQVVLCLDANMHGISMGRVDQYLGGFLDRDLKEGRITEEYAQELMDLLYLKIAEMNKPWSYGATQANPGYTSGQLMCLGGVDKNGDDATNKVTYMMLQTMGRLVLHDPPQTLRINKNTPPELWEAAIETTKICGGVPTFENDDVIIPALMKRGLSLESARNYSPIGCVEPGGTGDEWPACGGTGTVSYLNLVNGVWLGINDGRLPMAVFYRPKPGEERPEPPKERVGLPTGHLYEMDTFEEVLEAYKKQIEFFVRWHAMNINNFEYVAREYLPLPIVSATMEGCMESGRDVMWGGAKYNSCGQAGVGIGNVADSLFMIKHLCFDTKKVTTRELYDALMANWKGHEELQRFIVNECPHYGNGNPEVDRWADWAGQVFADAVTACTGPRGHYAAGLYPVTTNVMFGMMTGATPDGRSAGQPLADGISPIQQMDKNGPTAILTSVSKIRQVEYSNGTLLNMKFSPSCLNGQDGIVKLTQLIQTYFDLGGMEMQINVISADTLKDAQKNPENYRNLVVRVAGFSAYFVELHISGQNDLISRTELTM
jgi:pyruvate formate-lyase/glycerol dehydratase family glycyl radical enzyme